YRDSRRSKGKRSGLRVIYYWWLNDFQFWLFTVRLDVLFAESDGRDRDKPGSAGPFSREEVYAARLDRFR
ncbi:MAG: hypothetical protein ACREXY_06385, partial [Gammaproteobacteria bacterium]